MIVINGSSSFLQHQRFFFKISSSLVLVPSKLSSKSIKTLPFILQKMPMKYETLEGGSPKQRQQTWESFY